MTPPKKPAAKRPRGRPAHKPTAATKMKVSVCAGSGKMTHQEIAIVLGISVPTLEKHYQYELSVGALTRRAEVLAGVYKAAKRGSSSAAKVFLANEIPMAVPPEGVGDGAVMPSQPAAGAASAPAPISHAPKAPAVGKKEQANIDAVTAQAGTDWEDLLKRPGAPIQ